MALVPANPALVAVTGLAAACLLAVAILGFGATALNQLINTIRMAKEEEDKQTRAYEDLLAQGTEAFTQDRFDDAIAKFTLASELPLLNDDRIQDARKLAEEAKHQKAEFDQHVKDLQKRAEDLARQKDREEKAAQEFKGLQDLGIQARNNDQFDDALAFFTRASELPDLNMELVQTAKRQADNAKELKEDNKKRIEEAKRKAEDLFKEYEGFLEEGTLAQKKMNFEAADKAFRDAKKLEPRLIEVGKLKLEDFQADKRLEALERAIRASQKEMKYGDLVQAGWDALKNNKPEIAVQKARDALPLRTPGDQDALNLLKAAIKKAGPKALAQKDYKGAKGALDMAADVLNLDPADKDARQLKKNAENLSAHDPRHRRRPGYQGPEPFGSGLFRRRPDPP